MTTLAEPRTRVTSDAAFRLLACHLQALGGQEADNPSEALETLLKNEVDSLESLADNEHGHHAIFAGLCCDFGAKAMFITMTEAPDAAISQIDALLADLRGDAVRLCKFGNESP